MDHNLSYELCAHAGPDWAASCVNASVLRSARDSFVWNAYLRHVYLGRVRYPVDLATFGWFYRCREGAGDIAGTGPWMGKIPEKTRCAGVPPAAPLERVVPFVKRLDAPAPIGAAFVGHRMTDGLAWMGTYGVLVRTHKRGPFPPGTWIEVIRMRHERELGASGAWHYALTGTGIWLNTGRTCVEDLAHTWRVQVQLLRHAAQRGCETVQSVGLWGADMIGAFSGSEADRASAGQAAHQSVPRAPRTAALCHSQTPSFIATATACPRSASRDSRSAPSCGELGDATCMHW